MSRLKRKNSEQLLASVNIAEDTADSVHFFSAKKLSRHFTSHHVF